MLEATIYLNDKPEGDVSGDITKGFQDRLEQRAIQTSPAMQYFNNYKKQQVVEEVDEQEELIPSLIGKTVREPEEDAFTQIYALNALDAQEPVQEVVQPEVDKPLLQEAWDILPTGGQQTVWPFIAPFVKGSAEENPILRGMTQGALHDAPQGMVDLSRDVVNAIGGEFKEEDWLKIPQILESNPDSTTEGVVRGLSQFMSIFGAAGGIGKGATLFKQMMAGGLADATFDPTGGNVATLLRELDMDNALTQFLDSKVGEDADALERLQARGKQVLEGAGIGFAIPTLIGGIKWAKNAGSPWIKEFMKDSDPALVQNTLKKFGVDMPQKDIVQGGPKKQTKETAADYRMTHTAARSEGKNSLDDFSESMPDNPNDPNFARYYGMGGEYSKADAETIAVMKAVRGKPDAEVTIYRAVPKGIKDINAGDWVSTSKNYANSHGERHIDGGYDVIEKKVRAGELNTDGDLHEWGYNPSAKQPVKETTDTLEQQAKKYKTSEEWLRAGGPDIDSLDEAAFGFSEKSVKSLFHNKLNIKWKDDIENVEFEIEKSGKTRKAWAKEISLEDPIDVVYENGKFFVDDGHHRYTAAKILGKEVKVDLTIKDKPIAKLTGTKDYNYEEYVRGLWDKANK